MSECTFSGNQSYDFAIASTLLNCLTQRSEVKFTQVAVLATHHIPSVQNALPADRQLGSVVIILPHVL